MSAARITTATEAPMPIGFDALSNERNFTFGFMDYTVFIFMLATSLGVGVYFGFFAKSKNTTDEYLIGGRRMKPIPIAISLIASQLSALSITTTPAESYAFGINHYLITLSMILVAPVLCYITTPIFYENNIYNCYEYLDRRFNKRTRQLITFSFIFNAFLLMPTIIFIPALAFTQVTGFNIHLVNAVVCSICVIYTMLGGIKAVVWTDVIQGGIMLSSVLLILVMGTIKTGGITEVFKNAAEGGRMDLNFSIDPRTRITFWNAIISGATFWTGHVGLNQSCLQRIVSLPSLKHAQKALWLASFGFIVLMSANVFNGIVMYGYYHHCDPMKAGLVNKVDKMLPFFVQDIMGNLLGMPGIFISCVFSASLSTMSAMLNSLAGIIYFDMVKPHTQQKHHTEERANFIMKIMIVAMGGFCVVAGFVVQGFDSMYQTIVTVSSITGGAVTGIFLLGMLVPRAHGKAAVISIVFSIVCMLCLVVKAQLLTKEGALSYKPIPTNTDGCEAYNLQYLMKSIYNSSNINIELQPSTSSLQPTDKEREPREVTTAFDSNRPFSIYEISFFLYKLIGILLVWIMAIPLSYIWQPETEAKEKHNPYLYAPFIRRFLSERNPLETEEYPLKAKFMEENNVLK